MTRVRHRPRCVCIYTTTPRRHCRGTAYSYSRRTLAEHRDGGDDPRLHLPPPSLVSLGEQWPPANVRPRRPQPAPAPLRPAPVEPRYAPSSSLHLGFLFVFFFPRVYAARSIRG